MSQDQLARMADHFQILFFMVPPGDQREQLRALWEEISRGVETNASKQCA